MPTQTVIEKLKSLQEELEIVAAAVIHIDNASKVAKSSSEILRKIPDLINDLKTLEEKYRQELLRTHKDKIDILEKELQSLLAEIKDKSKQLTELIDETRKLENIISNYYTEIEKIHFPERLDKIDNQISAINIGVGNLQTAIQNTQTSISTLSNAVEKRFSTIEATIANENKKVEKGLKLNRVIQIVGFIVTIVILVYLSFKL